MELSAWIVDWQWKSGVDDLNSFSGGLTSIQAFAAYFDDTDSLYFTSENREALPRIREAAVQSGLVNVDLTVVNDRLNRDGSAIQKDSTLVTRLMATVDSRNKHMEDLLRTVAEYDFDGVEIDYEKIAESDWDNVSAFYTELYRRLHALGKSLRIELEPRTPIERLTLPEGPHYVMMAYNVRNRALLARKPTMRLSKNWQAGWTGCREITLLRCRLEDLIGRKRVKSPL